jgi:hypothetical protein
VKLRRVELRGVRTLPDAAFDLVDPRSGAPLPLVLVTGPTASGKTRFLEAILAAKEQIAPYTAPPSAAAWIRPDGDTARIALTFQLDERERAYGALDEDVVSAEAILRRRGGVSPEDDGIVAVLRRYEHGDDAGKIEYFPALRSIPANGIGVGLSAFEQRSLRASGDARKYACVVRVIYELAAGGPRAERFAAALARLSPTCRFEPAPALDAFPRCFTGLHGGPARGLDELSHGEVDAVIFAATATLIGLGRSIVLVDTPELFCDPAFLPAFAEGLLALGEDVQVIAATRAPELLRAASPGQVIDLGAVPR